MSWHVRVITGRYADSMRLMGVARDIRATEGVDACELGMGTAANLEALSAMGATGVAAGPGDVVIAVRAEQESVAIDALVRAERGLVAAAPGGARGDREVAAPRTIAAARAGHPDANVAIVSVPGEYATLEAHRALSQGMHVFLFSDHVSLRDELALKRRAAGAGLLVMGPGCGTAMLGGVGLGFMNVVRRGPVGVVAAAGTGAQEVACLLDAAGTGVSQIIGVGGRDLSEDIGGVMFRQAMRMLADDPETETLLLVSKPPSPAVVRTLGDDLPDGVRVVAAFVGWEGGPAPFEVHATLEAGARAAAGVASEGAEPGAVPTTASGGRLLALYSGGSLAHEALTILEPHLPVAGNVSHHPAPEGGHTVLDLGEEEYTRGRPHPMVDLGVRLEMLDAATRDDTVGCVLLDLVLGHGAHPDPAPELAPLLRRLSDRVPVVAHVCGTPADPQDRVRQESVLAAAGVEVQPSNAAAARRALAVVGG